jgi:P4 family phage/plasmid primase-like protien
MTQNVNEVNVIKWKNYIYNFVSDTDLTHLAFNGGKYKVPDSKYEEFYKNYYQQLINGNTELFIIEKVQNSRFAYFLDIEVPKGDTTILTKDSVDSIITKMNKIINDTFNGTELTENVVSQRTINATVTKYHINYYNLIVTSNIAQAITKKLISELETLDLKKVIDISVYRTGLRLYGSKKSNKDSDKEKLNYGDSHYQSVYTCDLKLTFEEFSKLIVRRTINTPLTELKIKIETPKSNVMNTKVTNVTDNIQEEIKRYLDFIKDTETFKNYKFDNIGKIVSTQNKNGIFCYYITLNETFCPFVNREHKRDSPPIFGELNMNGFVIKCYDSDCITQRYGETPLHDSFMTDYPHLYLSMNTRYYKSEIVLTSEMRNMLEDSLCMSHFKIAKVAYNIYKNRFRIDELKNPEWYEFDGSKWKKSYVMNILISEDLPRYYRAIRIKDAIKETNGGENEENETDKNVRNQLINGLISKLENVSFKKNVLTEMYYLFKQLEPNFISKLDANPYLMGFNNGVYDFKSNVFRKGELTDYVTFSTGYDYIEYDNNSIEVKEIYDFLGKIITNKRVFEYLLKILGRSLIGISDESFHILTGLSGANGKSTLINFLEDTLADYNTAVDVSLLTNKRALSASASPDVIRLRGKRYVSFAEPEFGDTLKTGILKAFSGGDSIIARELYKAPISFKLQASMFLVCNDLPNLSSIDGGTIRRIRVIEFKSRFCDNPTKENEFMIDPTVKGKLQMWRPYFMSILIHWYNKYESEVNLNGKIEIPSEVTQATNKYKNENDKFNEFFEECVTVSNTFVQMKDIYRFFNMWWSNNNINNYKIPDVKELVRAMKLKYGGEDDYTLYKGFKVHINLDETVVQEEIDDLI